MDALGREMKQAKYLEAKRRAARICTHEWASSAKLGVIHAELDMLHRQGVIEQRVCDRNNGVVVLEYRIKS